MNACNILYVFLAAAGTVSAQQGADRIFNRFDRNGDGRVTPAELRDREAFARYDLDADGVITLAEYHRKVGERLVAAIPAAVPVPISVTGPDLVKPGDVGVGRMVPDVAFVDRTGKPGKLSTLVAGKGAVVALTSATCPVSKRWLPSLAALDASLRQQGIPLLLVNPFASETDAEIAAQLAEHPLQAPYVHDRDKAVITALQARSTTEVFLLDATRTVIYRGALDDQYGLTHNQESARHHYLQDAIDAFRAGTRPRIEATGAPGCDLDLPAADAVRTRVTYYRDVARILGQNCVHCHHDGGIAPFALTSAEEVLDRAKVIRRVVTQGIMPPWFAAPPADGAPSPWANDCSLAARDKADLLAWIESIDRPLGNPAEAPAPRKFSDDWTIGKPDLVIQLSRAYNIPATGFMPYQHDVVETTFAEDRWVSAYEIVPSARDVVHHVIIKVHPPGNEIGKDREGIGGYWAAYVPGTSSHVYPDGFARRLPAGARISFQIHYTPSGKATRERLQLGLIFAKTPPVYEMKTLPLANTKISIPPGEANHEETFSRRAPFDIPITSLLAHMHVRGKAFKFELIDSAGKSETLLDIPTYDFNWQLRYDFRQPRIIPRGSTVKITAIFDNSADNKANPDPTKLVKWGDQTYEEMMIGYLEYYTAR